MSELDIDELEELIEGYAEPKKEDLTSYIAARTGILSLDLNLGGGLPSGLVEIYGESGTGKTALVGQIIAHNQKAGRQVALIAAEKEDTQYLEKLGADLKNLPLMSIDDVFPYLSEFPRAVVMIDSLAAVRPMWVDDWNEFIFESLCAFRGWAKLGQCVVITNQVRAKRSMLEHRTYAGGTESLGRKIHDLYTTRIELGRHSVSEDAYVQLINIVSNVFASPSRYLELQAHKGTGIDRFIDLVQTAASVGVIEKRHNSYRYGGELLGAGIASAVVKVKENKKIEESLVRDVLARVQ